MKIRVKKMCDYTGWFPTKYESPLNVLWEKKECFDPQFFRLIHTKNWVICVIPKKGPLDAEMDVKKMVLICVMVPNSI